MDGTKVGKRSWIPVVAGATFMGLWYLLGAIRGEPNQGLVEHLGGASWGQLQTDAPALAETVSTLVTLGALLGVALTAVALAVALGPLRRGERWAWLTLWVLPTVHVALFVNDLTGFPSATGEQGTYGPLFLVSAVLVAAGLLLSGGVLTRRQPEAVAVPSRT